ncbi:MAG: Ig-like domain-containing protein [Anaerolineae bacterium]
MKNNIRNVLGKWTAILLLPLIAMVGLAQGSNQPRQADENPHAITSPLGGTMMTDPTDNITLISGSQPPTPLSEKDYFEAYKYAQALLTVGINFRSKELQRLDPATCVADDNYSSCSFTVDGIENNYLDFNNGRQYWRFCADYDEPFVGAGNVPHHIDDPDDELKLNPYGYCPEWADLVEDQKSRRVAGSENQPLGQGKEIDIRNQMVDALRLFGTLAMAEPANLTFDGTNGGELIDLITVEPDGRITAGPDGQPDRARDLGIHGLLIATREIASIHLILGNEFMVDAVRFPFSTGGTDSEQLVKTEQEKLTRALRQFELATDIFFVAMNYNLRAVDQNNTFIGDYFTDREFQLFTTASDRTVTALTEIAKRDRLLGTTGDEVAIKRLEDAALDQYLQGVALAYQATRLREDDPQTPKIDESKDNFLNNGGLEILNNIRQLMLQTQNIRAGLNPLGYDPAFVPLRDFETLFDLTCGGTQSCGNSGLLESADSAQYDLKDGQWAFDKNFGDLQNALTSLQDDYDDRLTAICGPGEDTDDDGLKEFSPCGFFDLNKNGEIDNSTETAGLIGDSYWNILAAEKEILLAQLQIKQNLDLIKIEEARANKVINITLAEGQTLSAYDLAIGKLNAYKETQSIASSSNTVEYSDDSVSLEIGSKVTVKASLGTDGIGAGIEFESYVAAALNFTTGTRHENATLSATERVWDPNSEIIGQYESLKTLAAAESQARIEGANSAAEIKRLLSNQSQLLTQIEAAHIQFNQAVNEYNGYVNEYALALTQRNAAIASIQESPLAKPYYRLFRDGAALEATRTLEQAQHGAYLTAKAFEYYTLSPIPYMHELYRARNAENIEGFLDKLGSDYTAISPENFSKVTYRLSLAEDIFGLTDANLNPHGLLTEDEVDALRTDLFQKILGGSRITNSDTGVDQIIIPFSTSLDHPKFLNGVFNNRISRTERDPGCTLDECRGVWLNIVTDQDNAELQGDFPLIKLSHGGLATYKDGNLDEVSYAPGPAVMVGRSLPPGFEGGTEADEVSTHVNLPLGAEPQKASNNFYNLSVATSQWSILLDLTTPVVNTQLDVTQIKDIELRMDTTYVTPKSRQPLVDLDRERVELETAGQPVPPELIKELNQFEAELSTIDGQAITHTTESDSRVAALPAVDSNRYVGTVTLTDPVPLGTMDSGFSLEIDTANQVKGTLCIDCGPLFGADGEIPITGSYNPADRSITFATGAHPREIAGRTAFRTWNFTGTLTESGDIIKGEYTEILTGFITRPIIATGTFLVSRPTSLSRPPLQRQLLVGSSAPSVERNGTVELNVLMRDGTGAPLPGISVTLATDNGSLSQLTGVTDENGRLDLTFTASSSIGKATITVQGDRLVQTQTIYIVSGAPVQSQADEATVDAGQAIEIDVLANDTAINGQLDPASVTIVERPIKGVATVDQTTGVITYQAANSSVGTDTFTYTVRDTNGVSSAATRVTVTVTEVDKPKSGSTIYLPLIHR